MDTRIVLTAEAREKLYCETARACVSFRDDARVVEDSIPSQVRQEDLHQRRTVPHSPLRCSSVLTMDRTVFRVGKNKRPALVLLGRQRLRQFRNVCASVAEER